MSFLSELINKFDNKSASVAIVGLGYVGLPLMLRYSDIGFKVIGFDIDQNKTDKLSQGLSYIEHISSSKIKKSY